MPVAFIPWTLTKASGQAGPKHVKSRSLPFTLYNSLTTGNKADIHKNHLIFLCPTIFSINKNPKKESHNDSKIKVFIRKSFFEVNLRTFFCIFKA